MDIFISRGAQDPEVRIRFPAEPDIVWPMLTELDEYCASNGPARIVGTSSQVPNLTQYISCADVEDAADIRKHGYCHGYHLANASTCGILCLGQS